LEYFYSNIESGEYFDTDLEMLYAFAQSRKIIYTPRNLLRGRPWLDIDEGRSTKIV
jgi:hypothetical protein